MLDENLPTFFLKPSPNGVKHHRSFHLTEHGSDPEPAYSLHQVDPANPNSRNCYATALFDAYNPETLFGEVLVRPGWTQPTLSQDEIRRNGGVPPPPQPLLPSEFTIQLYNPDQQVTVTQRPGSWGGSASYEFSMPQTTFRLPSTSAIDRTLNDPAADETTPLINFVWRREGKLSKDFTCFMTGKSTDAKKEPSSRRLVGGSRQQREPDIAVALFRTLREITVYEPNLHRVDMEDPKGLEVVLLLGAAAIKDLYFGPIREAFNIHDPSLGAVRKDSGGSRSARNTPPLTIPQHHSPPPLAIPTTTSNDPPPPAVDPRTEWEHNAETARLRAASDAEARTAAARQRERERAAEAEAKRLRRQVEAEAKEARRRQADVDRETERLRRKYGGREQAQAEAQLRRPSPQPPQQQQQQQQQQQYRPPQQPQQHHPPRPQQQPGRHSAPLPQGPFRPAQPQYQRPPTQVRQGGPVQRPPGMPARPAVAPQPKPQSHPLYLQAGSGHATATSSASLLKPEDGQRLKAPKKSFWGLRGKSEEQGKKTISKKRSSMF